MEEESEGGCDEADFIEIIIASERIAGWLEVMQSSHNMARCVLYLKNHTFLSICCI